MKAFLGWLLAETKTLLRHDGESLTTRLRLFGPVRPGPIPSGATYALVDEGAEDLEVLFDEDLAELFRVAVASRLDRGPAYRFALAALFADAGYAIDLEQLATFESALDAIALEGFARSRRRREREEGEGDAVA